MSEIEKMYELAGIEKDCRTYKNYFECPFKQTQCEQCDNYDYPPFNAKKQLSLMAFLINRKVGLSFKAEQGEITVEAISRGLAGIVNRIWQDLTEEERKQIKEILK